MELCKNKPLDEIFIFFNFKEFDALLKELNYLGVISEGNTPICYSIYNSENTPLSNTESKFKYIVRWYMGKESFSIVSYDMEFNHRIIAALKTNKLVSDIEMYIRLNNN